MPSYVHSDRGAAFMSRELRDFLTNKGIASSRTTSYNPQCNGQAERYNGIIWKAVSLGLKTANLPTKCWQQILPDALHSVRSLLSTATNETPHERLFSFSRRSTSGTAIPTWLSSPGPVLLKRHVRHDKNEPLVDEVQLLQANPQYAHVRYSDGRETTVSIRHLAPCGTPTDIPDSNPSPDTGDSIPAPSPETISLDPVPTGEQVQPDPTLDSVGPGSDAPPLRRSERNRRVPDRLNYY